MANPGITPQQTLLRQALGIPAKIESGPASFNYGTRLGLYGGLEGQIFNVAFIGLNAAMAERGELIPTVASGVLSIGTFAILSAAIGGALAATGVGATLIPFIAPGLAAIPQMAIDQWDQMVLSRFTHSAHTLRTLHMGGDYRDTESAQNYRMHSIQQMNATMQSSRRYLGREAAIFADR